MPDNLLQMCQHAADRAGISRPTAIMASNSSDARMLRSCAQDEGESLTRRPENGWIDMIREHTFDTVASQAGYSLPSDYKYLVDGTLWDRGNYWELRGPLSMQDWQTYKSSILGDTATTRSRFRIHNLDGTGRKFYLDPTPTSVVAMVFEYLSTSWCTNVGGDAQSRWQADTDLPVLDDYLFRLGITWRLLDRLGLDYAETRAEYEDGVDKAIARDGGKAVLSLTRSRDPSLITTCNVPDTGYGS